MRASKPLGNYEKFGRVILLAHGSKAESWKKPFELLLQRLQGDGKNGNLSLAYMEFTGPTLEDALEQARLDSVENIAVLPLFIAVGTHVGRDVPQRIAAFQSRYPEIEVELLPALGEDAEFIEILAAYIAGYLQKEEEP